ncbi:hypothetical protein STEG23_015236, partial [Scotinomys teguina]
ESKAEENTMGQTVNEESMDAKNDNEEKAAHSDSFDWDKYLKETDSISAPSEYFKQSKIPPTNEFKVGMKLEVHDPRNFDSVCIASVISTAGARLRLRLDGGDNKNDFWRLVDSSDIQPVGTCEQAGDLLQPPLGFRMNILSWPMFLVRTLAESELAPAVFFKKEPPSPPQNNFKVGMKIEAVDRKNPILICPATIGAVKGDEIYITFDGWGGIFDYWCKYDSRDIFPVGWCRLTGDVLQTPGNCAEKKLKSRGVTTPWKDGATDLESVEAAPAGKKPKGRGFTKAWDDEARPGKDVQTAPVEKKLKGKRVTKPGKRQATTFEDEAPAPAKKKRKGKTATKPLKEHGELFEYEEESPAKKKRKGKTATKPLKEHGELFEYEEESPAKKKRKDKTVTKPWKEHGERFEYEEQIPAKKKRKGRTVNKPWKEQVGFFEYEEESPAKKKRKGKKVTKPWKDQAEDFEDEEAALEKKCKRKRASRFWKEQTKLLEDEEAVPALFSALSVHSAENTPPSSAEQTKSTTSEDTQSSTSEKSKSPPSKRGQSSKKSPRKTTIVLPVPMTTRKSGQTKPTGDTSATEKVVLPKKIGTMSVAKEEYIPVVSSTSSASLSSLMESPSSSESSAVPSKTVMSTVCIYINKHEDCGPYLDPQKVQQLPDHFGPGPVNVILRRTVQACVNCGIDSKAVFLFLKPDTRGGEIITATFDGKVHSVELPPVNSASFALRFLENFCHSLQCDKLLSNQPFTRKALIHTPTTDLDQNKPASSYIAVPDPSVLKQGFSKDPSTWSVDEVIQFMKHTDPHISGPLADLFRQHVMYLLIRFSCCPNAFE